MDSEIEECDKQCANCQQNQHNSAKAPLHPWDYPKRPWVRLHADYAGPVKGKCC